MSLRGATIKPAIHKAGVMTNKGYSEAGASTRKRSMRGFRPQSTSPVEDIDKNNATLRQRARALYMASPIATSAIKTHRTNTIGIGLKLNPRLDGNLLGMTTEETAEWKRIAKREFDLWANKKQNCDVTKINDFYAMQQLIFTSWLTSGDVFVLREIGKPSRYNPYTLRLHVIEADRCATPSSAGVSVTEGKNEENGNLIHDGVEVDASGAVVAYWFRSTHPNESTTKELKWTRVEAYGEITELPNVFHVMNSERPEQYRGVTYLAQIIEPILQTRRYTESELEAALIESFFTAFIKTNADVSENPLSPTEPIEEQGIDKEESDAEYEMGPGTFNVLEPGEDIVFGDPKRPASGFPAFMASIATQIGAALEIPSDLLLKEFKASYSASRAALLEAWKAFKMYREWFVQDFLNPVYEIWLSEAVALGRVNAPGFFGDPLIHQAYLGAEWVGPSQGQLDPVKEIQAEAMAIEYGFTTREAAAIKLNGSDFEENIEQLKREQALIGELAPAPFDKNNEEGGNTNE